MDKPIRVGVIGGRTVVIDGYFDATKTGYDVSQTVVAALTAAKIIEIVDLDKKPEPTKSEDTL